MCSRSPHISIAPIPHLLLLRVLSSPSILPPFCRFPIFSVRDSLRILSIIGRNPEHRFPFRSGNRSSLSSGDNSSYPIILSPTIFTPSFSFQRSSLPPFFSFPLIHYYRIYYHYRYSSYLTSTVVALTTLTFSPYSPHYNIIYSLFPRPSFTIPFLLIIYSLNNINNPS